MQHPSSGTSRHHRSDVTYPYSTPDLSAVVRPAPGGDREEVLIPATMISDLANEHGLDQKWLAQFRQMLDQVAALGWWDASTDYLKVHVERLHTERQ